MSTRGYRSYIAEDVFKWFEKIPEESKRQNGVNYNIATIKPSFEDFCKKRRKENKKFETKRAEEKAKAEKEAKEKLRKIAVKNPVKATELNELAKPKDNLLKGKTLMELKKMFPNDKIL